MTEHNSKTYQVDGLTFDVTPGNHEFWWVPKSVRQKGIELVEIDQEEIKQEAPKEEGQLINTVQQPEESKSASENLQ